MPRERTAGAWPRATRWPLLAVLAGVAVGLLVLAVGWWRQGIALIGLAVVLGGVLRLTLPKRTVGLLQVRTRGLDGAMLLLTGLAIVVLALVIRPAR